ncbi:hypothetical protein F4810DRAFT_709941 [Camillea tinctor]|nr:hypothetical protein F4810DRAFT_709941 [Camillea tinctor]
MAKSRGRKSEIQFRLALYSAMQAVFALIIFIIFILAFVIQSGGIVLPQWAKTWQGVSPDLIPEYAGALLGAVCVVGGLCAAAGIMLIRSEALFPTPAWLHPIIVTTTTN